jgi:hypothetical protein
MMGLKFLLDITDEEIALGFSESRTGVRAIVVDLGAGLRAVKVRAPGGETAYAVCDELFRPLYTPATSLQELRARFPALRRVKVAMC